ncbi:dynein light intermediate chain (DLIC) domain-containing protein [Ditylenchus destructor]|nr:dynein light intermediate chain (DLIC) domain-containing protein [Ditylenchus destructor]
MLNIFELAKQSYEESQRNHSGRLNLGDVDDEQSGSISEREAISAKFAATTSGGGRESTVLVCGSENCGKSTLVSRFLDPRASDPGQGRTIAMDYNYATRTRQNVKDLAHIWELGGGGSLANLLEIVLNDQNIESTSLILFLDLTRPEHFQAVVEPILDVVRRRLDHIMAQIQINQPSMYERISKMNTRKWQLHKDVRVAKPFPIRMAVIGAKYDEFQNFDTERKRSTFRLLRFIAHANGASIQTHSSVMETLMNRTRSLFGHFAFGVSLGAGKANSVDIHNPVFVSAGEDSLESIGLASALTSHTEAMSQWMFNLNESFPQEKIERDEDPAQDKQFTEPLIDELIEEKTRALELFVKERRDRQAAQDKSKLRLTQT